MKNKKVIFSGKAFEPYFNFWQHEMNGAEYPFEFKGDIIKECPSAHATFKINLTEKGAKLISRYTSDKPFETYAILFSAVALILNKYSSSSKGSLVSPLVRAELDTVWEKFVWLSSGIKDDITVREHILNVTAMMKDRYQYQNFPLDILNTGREIAAKPENISNVFISFRNFHVDIAQEELNAFPFQVFLFGNSDEGAMRFEIRYDSSQYSSTLVEMFSKGILNIIEQYDELERSIGSLIFLCTEDEQRIHRFNETAFDVPDISVSQYFDQIAKQFPQVKALTFQNDTYTYQQLNILSTRFSNHLQKHYHIAAGDKVCVHLQKSAEWIISILAILKAGGTYVPMDVKAGALRNEHVLTASKAKLIISRTEVKGNSQNIPLFSVQNSMAQLQNIGDDGDANFPPAESKAYLMFTSGSTGKAKGVEITHGALLNTSMYHIRTMGITEKDCYMQFMSGSFDGSLLDIFTTLLAGAHLVVPSEETIQDSQAFLRLMVEQKITITTITPSYLTALGQSLPPSLRILISAGEPADPMTAFNYSAQLKFYNGYGPTEAAINTTLYEVQPGEKFVSVPIGHPSGNTEVYIVDDKLNMLPIGAKGEICISGKGVADGYVNEEELTRKKFISNPFQRQQKMYRTGDYGRWLFNGAIQFYGRIDDQVKIRGFRVEIAEVTSLIKTFPDFNDAFCFLSSHDDHSQVLALAVNLKEASVQAEIYKRENFFEWLKVNVPLYMHPQVTISLPQFPLTSNGKVDKRALEKITESLLDNVPETYAAPQTPHEIATVEIINELLNKPNAKIARTGNLFELGIHSILANQLSIRLFKKYGVNVSIGEIFENPVVFQLAELVSERVKLQYDPIPLTTQNHNRYPLSDLQKQLWLSEQSQKTRIGYILPVQYRLKGNVDFDALQNAIHFVIQRHESLRTTIRLVNGEPYQEINEFIPGSYIECIAVVSKQDEINNKLSEFASNEAQTEFNLAQGPLIRVKLLKVAEDDCLLLLTMHHLIADGWSINLILREIVEGYNASKAGMKRDMTPLRIQYKDYAAWQLKKSNEEGSRNFWLEALRGDNHSVNLLPDFPRSAEKTIKAREVKFALDREITTSLLRFCQKNEMSLFILLQTLIKFLLHKYTGRESIATVSPITNRVHPDLENQVGFYVNTLALKTSVNPKNTLKELLMDVRHKTLEAYKHQTYPFNKLIEALMDENKLGRSPAFDIYLDVQIDDQQPENFKLDGLDFERFVSGYAKSVYDLEFIFIKENESISGSITYPENLFKEERITFMRDHILNIIHNLINHEQETLTTPLGELDYLSQLESEKILIGFNNSAHPFDRKTIHRLFEDVALRCPDAPAILDNGRTITYKMLNEQANKIAHYLLEDVKIQQEDQIVIYCYNTVNYYPAILAILKAGAAYLPFDASFTTKSQIEKIVSGHPVKAILTESTLLDSLPKFNGPIFAIDVQPDVLNTSIENPRVQCSADNLAYIMFTSGTSGKAKGVMIEHRSVVNLAQNQFAVSLDSDTRVLLTGALGFDATTFEIWGPLLNGGSIYVIGRDELREVERLKNAIANFRINTLWMSSSLFNQVVDADVSVFHGLTRLIVGGDVVSAQHVLKVKQINNGLKVVNGYGPTENTTFSTFFEIGSQVQSIPIGRPLNNRKLYILDAKLKPVPVGVIGEIYLGGEGVARGYYDDPELTGEKFLINPFHTGDRLYKSGDLGYFLPDGNVIFIGRSDDQVKIRGFRVEVAAIRKFLLQHPLLNDAYPYPYEQEKGDKYIRAVLVPNDSAGADLEERMKQLSAQTSTELLTLPNSMKCFYINRSETEFIYNEIFEEKIYDRKKIILNDGDVVVDAGANIGLFTMYLGMSYNNIKVYSIEPMRPIFETLKLNCELYGINARLLNVGLSNEQSKENFYYFPYYTSASGRYANSDHQKQIVKSFLKNSLADNVEVSAVELEEMLDSRLKVESFEVDLLTLSQIIETEKIKRIDLLKLDCEKSELDILHGIKPEHWSMIRQVVIEVHNEEDILTDLETTLKANGFNVEIEQADDLQNTTLFNLYAYRDEVHQNSSSGRKALPLSNDRLIQEVQEYLKSELPAYMIPQEFLVLSRCPLTSNGKVDLKAANELFQAKYPSANNISAPSNSLEVLVSRVWEEVLLKKGIDIKVSFFDVGGDSIKAIQIASKLHRAGFKIEVKDIFSLQTIQEIASHLQAITDIPDQSLVVGPITLTPIQEEFFHWNLKKKNHFNQGLMLSTSERLSTECLQAVFTALQEHHDMLRVTFVTDDHGRPSQVCNPAYGSLEVTEYDLRDETETAFKIESIAQTTQEKIDLSSSLFKVAYFKLKDSDRLLLISHHLIIDSVSWRILLEDISTLIQQHKKGERLNLPFKTHSYRAWSERIQKYAEEERLLNEKKYWIGIEDTDVDHIPTDHSVAENLRSDEASAAFELTQEETQILLTQSNRTFNADISELLLTSLAEAICYTFNISRFGVMLEAHGRDGIVEELDVKRTVGWFTSLFPVVLENNPNVRINENVTKVKQTLRNIPDKGFGYSVLRFSTPPKLKEDLRFSLMPQVSFNYLGQLDSDFNHHPFGLAPERIGRTIHAGNKREFQLEAGGMVLDGKLQLAINYNSREFNAKTIEAITSKYGDSLRKLVQLCTPNGASRFTAKDLSADNLSTIQKLLK